jgi:hypothetical protein
VDQCRSVVNLSRKPVSPLPRKIFPLPSYGGVGLTGGYGRE